MDPVLREIRFDISPKQKIGIVGRTGAGREIRFDISPKQKIGIVGRTGAGKI